MFPVDRCIFKGGERNGQKKFMRCVWVSLKATKLVDLLVVAKRRYLRDYFIRRLTLILPFFAVAYQSNDDVFESHSL